MLKDVVDCTEIQNFLLREVVLRDRVVVFASSITDIRAISLALARRRLSHCVVLMRMEDERTRDRFHLLTENTHWPYLPQIFFDGEFVGGDIELFKDPRITQQPGPRRQRRSRLRWRRAERLVPRGS